MLKLKDIKKDYVTAGSVVHALKGVSLEFRANEFVSILGASGCGKTTTLRMIAGFEEASAGVIKVEGERIEDKEPFQRNVNTVFQNYALFRQKTVYENIAFGLRIKKLPKEEIDRKVKEMLKLVALEGYENRKVDSLSGGQQQRIGIARAVATNPKLIVADEPVSALDLSVQAQVLNFMKLIQKDLGIAFLFISHDLGVVRHMTDNIAVMHNGRIVEKGTRRDIFDEPQHIYTKRLLSAIPSIDVTRRAENRKNRLKVEQDFEDKKANFYDKDGHALPLKKLSESHWAALPKGGENVESNY